MTSESIIKTYYSKNELVQKVFNISFAFIKRSLYFNEKEYKLLLKNNISFDLLTLTAKNPKDIKELIYKKNKSSIFFFKDSFKSFICDFYNFLKILQASLFKKNIIISSKRWVKDEALYEKSIKKIVKPNPKESYSFAYLKIRNYHPRNELIMRMREKLYKIFNCKFDSLVNTYKNQLNEKNSIKFIDLFSSDNVNLIKSLFLKNQAVNHNSYKISYLTVIFFELLYNLMTFLVLKTIKNKNLYIINTNVWTVGNLLIERILLKKEVSIFGCQHGGGYKERKNTALDVEINCPSFEDFIGFKLFKSQINASQILNLKDSEEEGFISYINGPNVSYSNTVYYQKECLEIISRLSKNYKCSVRLHPKNQAINLKKFINIDAQGKSNYQINFFYAKNKFEAISKYTKICIFDYPYATLFWDAQSRGIKTVLVYNIECDKDISKEFINLFDLVINPSQMNWESSMAKLIQKLKYFRSV